MIDGSGKLELVMCMCAELIALQLHYLQDMCVVQSGLISIHLKNFYLLVTTFCTLSSKLANNNSLLNKLFSSQRIL